MAVYAQITNLSVPSKASPGSRVDVVIGIKNLASIPISIMAECKFIAGGQMEDIIFDTQDWMDVNPGWVGEFRGHFTMPNASVIVRSFAYYYTVDGWYFDDQREASISVQSIPASFSNLTFDYSKR